VLVGWDEARAEFTRRLRAQGLSVLTLAVSARPVPDPPAWLRILTPGRIGEALAAL
jgi:hypothetical protein